MPTLPSASLVNLQDETWLWCQSDSDTPNQVGCFRRTLTLEKEPDEAVLHISADARYWLYVNGHRVEFGPARYPIERPFFDTIDLRGRLRRGTNVLAVRVHGIGQVKRCSSFMPRRCALLARLDLKTNGRHIVLHSDSQWRAMRSAAYAATTPRHSNHQGFIECFDARQEPADWTDEAFDDSGWPAATVLGPTGDLPPWRELRPRPIPMMHLQRRLPARVLESGRLHAPDADWHDLSKLAGHLATATRLPADDAPLLDWPLPLASAEASQPAYILLDFAENDDGFITLDLDGEPGTVVDLGYCESVTDDRIETFKQRVNYCDRVILGERRIVYHPAWAKTLQYLMIAVRGRVTIHGLWHDVCHYPMATRGRFACSDPCLERVWQVGLNTVRMTAQDVYMDTPRRERAGWLADLRPQALVTYGAFGDTTLLRHQIRLFLESQDHDGVHVDLRPDPRGWVISRWPSIDGARMPDFTAMMPMILRDYWHHTGDLATIEEHWPRLSALANHIIPWIGDDGLARFPGYRHNTNDYLLIDWAPIDRRGANAAMNMVMVGALAALRDLASALSRSDEAQRFDRTRTQLAQQVRAAMFDARRGVFVNGVHEGRPLTRFGYQENLLALLYDVASPEQRESIQSVLLNDQTGLPSLDIDPDTDLYPSIRDGIVLPWDDAVPVAIGSPYFTFYAVWALMACGQMKLALATLRRQYGPSLAGGASTVWEEWHGGTSRSHGWSAGPTWLLGRYVLGVEPRAQEPMLSVLPALGDLAHACGRVATRWGVVQVDCRMVGDVATMEVSLPRGCQAQVGLPVARPDAALRVNGKETPSTHHVTPRGDYRVVTLGKGLWRLSCD